MVDAATEGGIPRSSCLEVSLKSLAFCGSVRKREATRRLAGIKGTTQRCGLHRWAGTLPNRAKLGGFMNTIKSLILGSAAVLAASVGAQAADLPVKAKAVQ